MSAIAAIIEKLEETSAVTDLCGTRIYSVSSHDGETAPHVIIQHIATDPGVTHGEAAGANEELYQLACFATTPKAAHALRDACATALDGVELSNGDNPTLEDKRDGEVADLGSGVKLYRADADLLV